jgi:hypothetical protein
MPALEDKSLLRQRCFIGGAWQNADFAETIVIRNPVIGETVGTVPFQDRRRSDPLRPWSQRVRQGLEDFLETKSLTIAGLDR